LVIPEITGLSNTYFLRLTLEDSGGKVVSTNWYWLSTKPDVLDGEKTTWWDTPTKSFADLTGLATLPQVRLQGSSTSENKGDDTVTHVTVENPTDKLAFFVHLRITRGREGKEVLPILWEDNYFELMPGEKRDVAATYPAKELQGSTPVVEVEAWNAAKSIL